jgi:hypothetical protein
MKIVNFAAKPFLAWRIIARHALWSGPSKIEQPDRRACDNFTLDKESPIQGQESGGSGSAARD